jgi:endonuclease YncB( thermonuclease family)
VAAGWATVKEQRDSTEGNDSDILVSLFNAAKAAKLGMHTDDPSKKRGAVRQINWTLDAAAYATNLLAPSKSPKSGPQVSSVRVVVEHVRDGASFRCFIPSSSAYVSVALAGIVCPRVNSGGKADSEGNTPAPEAFALQARHFSEMRLLNREVELAVHGAAAGSGKVASEGSLLVTLGHPKVRTRCELRAHLTPPSQGNLTLELVKAGLGKIADWTLALLPRSVTDCLSRLTLSGRPSSLSALLRSKRSQTAEGSGTRTSLQCPHQSAAPSRVA